jgi:glycerophosphoryl diester phosphodiesterase
MRWGARGPKPLVIAHRGASAEAPENSLAAFHLARAHAADGIELDVMRCGSGEVVVFHDDDLTRLGGRPGLVRHSSFDELRTIDLGNSERIPLLSEVLAELGPDLLVNIELKTAPTWRERLHDDGLAIAVADLILSHGLPERALVSSFDPLLLARFRVRAPRVATGLLFAREQALPYRHGWPAHALHPTAMHPEAVLVDKQAVDRWHERQQLVNVWTVDDPAELRWLAALGVDGLITNRPAEARALLDEPRPQREIDAQSAL